MIVMTYTGHDGEGCECGCHEFYPSLHTVDDLAVNKNLRDKYYELKNPKRRHSAFNPKFFQLVRIPDNQIEDAMQKQLYTSMTKDEKRKWLLKQLQDLEN